MRGLLRRFKVAVNRWIFSVALFAIVLVALLPSPANASDEVKEIDDKISSAIDNGIVATLEAAMQAMVRTHTNVDPNKLQIYMAGGQVDESLRLKIDGLDCSVLYSGDQSKHFDRGKIEVARPGVGVVLRWREDATVQGERFASGTLILRNERKWQLATPAQIIDTLRGMITTPIPPGNEKSAAVRAARSTRSIGAMGCVILAADAEPLKDELLTLLKVTPLESDEVVGACKCLAQFGGAEVNQVLAAALPRVKNHATMRLAVENAIKDRRKLPAKSSVAPPKDPETAAATELRVAKTLLAADKELGRKRLQAIVEKYPGSKTAADARKLLDAN